MSRYWQAQEGETSRAFGCFSVYRDLGPGRTLREAANLFYGGEEGASPSQYDQVKHWSARHDWTARARAFDNWLEMEKRAHLQEHLAAQARDHAEREAKLRELSLELRELAGQQAKLMMSYPITRQERIEEGPDGEEVTFVFEPTGWNKATAIQMHNMMVGDTTDPDPFDPRYDYSVLSDEELMSVIAAMDKVSAAPRLPPEQPPPERP